MRISSLEAVARLVIEASILLLHVRHQLRFILRAIVQFLFDARKPFLLLAREAEFLLCDAILEDFNSGAARGDGLRRYGV